MAEIIDINDKLRTKKIAESLSGSGKIFCHPDDRGHFDWLPDNKVQTSSVMEAGKPYAIDIKAMMDFLSPERLVMDFRRD